MNFSELLDTLQKLKFGYKINQMSIANVLGLSRQTMSKRFQMGTEVTVSELQGELGYLDKAMARIMGIDEKRYMRIKLGKEDATAEQLARLASKVDVSLDWLMFG